MGSPQGLANNQVTVAASATLICQARPDRRAVTIVVHGDTPVQTYIGGAGVTTANGVAIPDIEGASMTLETAAAIYGIVASGTQVVGVFETFG